MFFRVTAIVTLMVSSCVPDVEPEMPPAEQANISESSCGLPSSTTHKTRRDGTRTVIYDGQGALAFLSNYAVNTDGAPNSYHPEDLGGSRGLAINTICNGATGYSARGEKFGPRQCQQLIDTFRQARSEGWDKADGARMRFYGVATKDAKQRVPCTTQEGKYKGYFVSTTSFLADRSKSTCDQERYLNALDTNFIIRPGKQKFGSLGMQLGDIAAVMNEKGDVSFALVGDTGPAHGLGEGSVALLKQLGNRSGLPKTRRDTYAYGAKNVITLVLPGARLSGKVTQAEIDELGQQALMEFGGKPRLLSCAKELQK